MPFLVIGGHAVSASGYPRVTGDVDLLVRKADQKEWEQLLLRIGYLQIQEHEVFARFQVKDLTAWPVDLMFVDDASFDGMFTEAVRVVIEDCELPIPSRRHLMALKLHALKGEQVQRYRKDFDDLLQLCLLEQVYAEAEEFKTFELKYGSQKVYDEIRDALKSAALV